LKAVRFHEFGGSEKLRFEEAPDPKINATEVLVRVRACALTILIFGPEVELEVREFPTSHIGL